MATPRIGCWIELPSPEIAEIVAGTGYDFSIIDLEHGGMGFESLGRMLMAFGASDTHPWVRVPEAGEAWIKRGLDAGAAAIMVPRVESVEQATRILGWATYGPAGRRGEGLAIARASGWGRDIAGYRTRWTARGGVILQIESREGLAAAPEIAALPGVTQLFFGPSDFSASLGLPIDAAPVREAAAEVARVASAAGIEAGTVVFPGSPLPALAGMGYTHVADQSDVTLLVAAFDAHLAAARRMV